MDEETQTLHAPEWRGHPGGQVASETMLVVLWSAAEPERAGEALVVDTLGAGTFGRQTRRETASRLTLKRIRPGRTESTGSPTDPHLSREQLQIDRVGQTLRIRNVGRCPLRVDGARVAEAEVRPGQLVELQERWLLLAVSRPPVEPGEVDVTMTFGAPDPTGMVGESHVAWELRRSVRRAAGREGQHVLILGPSGSGKELVASALHRASSRSRGPWVARSAATFPEGLVDAELFGNVRGYPNPGMRERPGLVGEASSGTLFLDEIGELPTEMQAHLLRVLDAGEYHRLGESRARRADLRLVAATNRPADSLKHDFAARFGLRVQVPGLDGRPEDIPLLVTHLLRTYAEQDVRAARFLEGDQPRLHPSLVRSLVQRRWHTHVRELAQLLWQAIDETRGDWLLLPSMVDDVDPPAPTVDPDELTASDVQGALESVGWSRQAAVRALGLRSRHQLLRLMRKHAIEPPTR